MRTLLAAMTFLGGLSALNPIAQAQRSQECQQAQNEDPTGEFASYPCWARESFARGAGSGGGD
jgi:hypothetical protein